MGKQPRSHSPLQKKVFGTSVKNRYQTFSVCLTFLDFWKYFTQDGSSIYMLDLVNGVSPWFVAEAVLKTSYKTKNCYAEVVLKTSRRHVLKKSWRHFLEDALKTLWRQTKFLLGISVSNKSKCLSNKSIFNKSISDNSKANAKCIN